MVKRSGEERPRTLRRAVDRQYQPFHNVHRLAEPSRQGGGQRRPLEQLVISLVHDARTRAGSNRQLASAIEPYLERDLSGTTISNWARGTREPAASAFLASALATGLSVDWYLERYLSGSAAPMARQPDNLEQRLATLEARVDELTQPVTEVRRQRRQPNPSARETRARKSG